MIEIRETEVYAGWFSRLRDERAKARINARIFRLANGNAGGHKSLGNSVLALRIDYGPGYRVYYTMLESVVVLLLCGGDKSSQVDDITKARTLAEAARKFR
ncbi:type II toxin-antitoxin system RelE/ParE family toxin [Rhizobium tumorigenes]|uniref:Type II toxin-antitoxin system RelE/ParE family toxin n=1 Tax=Rhizobium tumorigenes TaxID=2041385 RepID=A0AAF1KWA9_9HYPH|nr:type II toxin-antitoxin system RelE/ParE family toxin [Rhizobium tumorigenes]WFR96324.1 type II toxin-antitoxin system RelE/ParE family toxin [Rhizobium tumorigenes]